MLPPIEAIAAIAALMLNKTASDVPAVATEHATPPPINAEVARNLGKVWRNLSNTGLTTFSLSNDVGFACNITPKDKKSTVKLDKCKAEDEITIT